MNNKINRFSTNRGYWHTPSTQFLQSFQTLYIWFILQKTAISCMQTDLVILGDKIFDGIIGGKFFKFTI